MLEAGPDGGLPVATGSSVSFFFSALNMPAFSVLGPFLVAVVSLGSSCVVDGVSLVVTAVATGSVWLGVSAASGGCASPVDCATAGSFSGYEPQRSGYQTRQ